MWLDRGSNPGPFADRANTTSELASHPVISPTTFHLNPTRLHMYQYTHHNLPMKFQLFIWSISLLVGDMMILWIKPLVVVWTIFLFFYLFLNMFLLVDVIMHERDVDKSSSHMWPVEHLGILSDIILNVPLVDFNMLLLLVYCN